MAEVLITLAIIGVVAALTIPTVVQNYREKQTVTQVKKFYSQINQAYEMAVISSGAIETWGSGTTNKAFGEQFKPYLKVIKTCTYMDRCFSGEKYRNLSNSANSAVQFGTSSNYGQYLLADGSSIFFQRNKDNLCNVVVGTSKKLQSVCGSVGIDINGPKKPNVFGRDIFYFVITKYGVYPYGTSEFNVATPASAGSSGYKDLSIFCNSEETANNIRNGYSCAAWILQNGNMDYLKHEVSWSE